ncbi:hypothetical protein KJ359_003592 [Pestalotiopsis sp. 9143b]|nr:hypothetical protein KJ359_003592 [Pestalotiopsis sp. 9143b]
MSTSELVIEVDDPVAKVDVVAIHELGHDRRETWFDEGNYEFCWLRRVFGGRVMLFGYETDDSFSYLCTLEGILSRARILLENLRSLRDDVELSKRPIHLVSHGIGGLFVKAAIVLASRDPAAYSWFTHALRGLVFFNYPHRSADAFHLRQQVSRHMIDRCNDPDTATNLVSHVETLSDTINGINGMFVQSKILLQAHMMNVVPRASSDTPQCGFYNLSTVMGIPFETVIEIEKPSSIMTRLRWEDILVLQNEKKDGWNADVLGEAQGQTLRALLSRASPVFPSPFSTIPEVVPDLDRLVAAESDTIVHFHFREAELDVMTSRVCSYLRKSLVKVIDFQFRDEDIRFSTVDDMIFTLISIICNETFAKQRSSVGAILKYLHSTQSWSTRHLLDHLHEAIDTINGTEYGGVFVLGGLHRCQDRVKEFITHLASISSRWERHLKMVITTSERANDDLCEEIAKLPRDVYVRGSSETIDLEEKNKNTKATSIRELRFSAWETSMALRSVVTSLADAYQQDDDMMQILRTWLAWDRRSWRMIELHVVGLESHCPEHIFEAILSSMPPERQGWAYTLLNWVALAFRPLLADEVRFVSAAVRGTDDLESCDDLLRCFNGLLKMENGELHFGHPQLRPWLISSTSVGWWRVKPQAEGHAEILTICLQYLTRTEDLRSIPHWPTSHNFLYAAEFWPAHYKLARSHDTFTAASPAARKLLDNPLFLERWVEGYRLVANLFTQIDEESYHPLAIAAHFGLEDLVEHYYESTSEAISLALVESVKGAQLPSVCKLLGLPRKRFHLEDPRLEKLLRAAASCVNPAILDEILKYMPEQATNLEARTAWMSDALLQAVMAEKKTLVIKLLELGAEPSVTLDPHDDPAGIVELAARQNAVDIIQVFIDKGIDICPVSGIGRASIANYLARWGDSRTIKLMFENGITTQTVDSEGKGLLYLAMQYGNYSAVSTLLELAPLQDYYRAGEATRHPLLIGARWGNMKCTEAMIKHGADLSVVDDDGNALSAAVRNGHLHLTRRLLEESTLDVNHSSLTVHHPLFLAIDSKQPLEFIELLLKHGANIEALDRFQDGTPLLYASEKDGPLIGDVVKLLLKHKANKEARDKEGRTPLYTACLYESSEAVQHLVDAGSVLYASCGEDQLTPLHTITYRPEIVSILLAKGVDPSDSVNAKTSPLEIASGVRISESVKLMLEQNLQFKEALGPSLLAAVMTGTEEVVRQLLEAGADVNHTDKDNTPVVFHAVAGGNEAKVRTILEFRPDLECKNDYGYTVGHCITGSTPIEVAKLLTRAGAKWDGVNVRGATPLILAVEWQNWDILRYLLSIEAARLTINIADDQGTALHWICYLFTIYDLDGLEIMQLLILSGADVHLEFGFPAGTALTRCCERLGENYAPEKGQMIRYLVEQCKVNVQPSTPDTPSPIHIASRLCEASIVKLLITKGANPQAVDRFGRKPLHMACFNSLAAVDALLVERDLHGDHDFTAVDILGRIPLHYSVASGQPELITHVLEQTIAAGLGIDVCDNDGWTPLMWAARNRNPWRWLETERPVNAVEVVKLLLEKGADPKIRGSASESVGGGTWSATDIAWYHDFPGLVTVLEERGIPHDKPLKAYRPVNGTLGCCGVCYLRRHGMSWTCQQCTDFWLCFKCCSIRNRVPGHLGHDFVQIDPEEDDKRRARESKIRMVESEYERDERSSDDGSAFEDGGNISDHGMDAISDDSSV